MTYDAHVIKLADMALTSAFEDEWVNLLRGRDEVLEDFLGCEHSAEEYLSLIYVGNLQAYADTLLVQAKPAGVKTNLHMIALQSGVSAEEVRKVLTYANCRALILEINLQQLYDDFLDTEVPET